MGRRIWIVLLSIALVGLTAAAVWVVPQAYDKLLGDSGTARSARAAVEAYLTALAAGDATTALSYSALQPQDTRFTSDEFYSRSLAGNPITNIVVPEEQDSGSNLISASYTLGDQAIEAHFTVQKHDRGWLLDGGFLRLSVADLAAAGAPLTLNGVPLGENPRLELLPGVYTLDAADPMLTVSSPNLLITYPESETTFTESLILSFDAIIAIQDAAKAHLNACLEVQALAPPGCGFGFAGTNIGVVNPESIIWTLDKDSPDLTTLVPLLDPDSLTTASGLISIKVNLLAYSMTQWELYEDSSTISQVKADFSDPDKIKIVFH
ncbi:MAG: hypothetical protein LBE83_06250 [Propionibacteriaceae bacterium]|jgi:hypothetical protein|nr:hypothetical protein [Propionibacteriaceae bacterium]